MKTLFSTAALATILAAGGAGGLAHAQAVDPTQPDSASGGILAGTGQQGHADKEHRASGTDAQRATGDGAGRQATTGDIDDQDQATGADTQPQGAVGGGALGHVVPGTTGDDRAEDRAEDRGEDDRTDTDRR